MPPLGADHPSVARILRRWRQLSGGRHTRDPDRKTLVACSGGADSVALAIALAQIPSSCVLAHIQHDMRTPEQAEHDRAYVEALAKRLGVDCAFGFAAVSEEPGNLEANAREARYQELTRIADEHACPYIATGHHADDQLETLLMHLMRGSGTRGMSGMRPTTPLANKTLLRPLLDIPRNEIETMLRELDIAWCHDQTNDDPAYVRNRIRQDLLPLLRRLDPEIARHASQWSQDLVAMQEVMDERVEATLMEPCTITDSQWRWSRELLQAHPDIMLGYLPGLYCLRVLDNEGADRITRRAIDSWIRSVKSDSNNPTEHRIGPIVAHIRAHEVRFTPAESSELST